MALGVFLDAHEARARIRAGSLVLEAGFNRQAAFQTGRLPGASYIDTSLLEAPPFWNLRPGAERENVLAGFGLTVSASVIIYARSPLPAARVAAVLLHTGIRDVYVLNGGLEAWVRAGYKPETGPPRPAPAVSGNLADRIEGKVFMDLARFRRARSDPGTTVVCVRSRREHAGITSGYPDIPAKGRIPGSLFGGGGSHKDDLSSLYRPDNTLQPLDTITARWKNAGIRPEDRIIFYCGTGWRASAAYLVARAADWPAAFVYDGGWAEWSSDLRNPIETGKKINTPGA